MFLHYKVTPDVITYYLWLPPSGIQIPPADLQTADVTGDAFHSCRHQLSVNSDATYKRSRSKPLFLVK